MDLNILIPLVEKINGCTFATIDALTEPAAGVCKQVTGERVIIYRTNGRSGYEAKVKRALLAAGKNPDWFTVGPLPWGTRLGNLPILEHKGRHYLQTILLARGQERHFLKGTNIEVNPRDFGIPPRHGVEGVFIQTYLLDNLERITLMGATLPEAATAEKSKRAVLSLKFPVDKEK